MIGRATAEPVMPSAQQTERLRRNSLIRREVRDGVAVYVKQTLVRDWEASAQQVCQRSGQEADVIRRIAASPDFGGRLGVIDLVDSQPEEAVVVTREVSGRPLQDFLLGSYRRAPGAQCLRAMLLAGRWLSAFQKIPLREEDHAAIGDQSPSDLVEYCQIRLQRLESLGYSGVSREIQQRLLRHVREGVEHSPPADRDLVLCHGDFGAFNILWDSRMLTAIDFTQSHVGVPLLDATYLIHRLQMLPIYFPWKRWPVQTWQRAFLQGYGRPLAVDSPMYQSLMIRHLLCRLVTYVRRPRQHFREKLHTAWVVRQVRRRLLRELGANRAC